MAYFGKTALAVVSLVGCSGTGSNDNSGNPMDAASPDVVTACCDADAQSNPPPNDSGTTPGYAWAFGDQGTRLFFDGTSWKVEAQEPAPDSGASLTYYGAWAGSSSLYVVGNQYTALVNTGGSWQPLPSPKGIGLDGGAETGILSGVWGSADNDVWVVEENLLPYNQPFLHWDGSTWTRSPDTVGPHGSVLAIYGTGPSDIWAAGNGGETATLTVWHYDGYHWSAQQAPVDLAVGPPALGGSPGSIWLGAASDIWHHDSSGWSSSLHTGGAGFSSLFGTGNDVWAASGADSTVHWNGTAWQSAATKVTASTIALGGSTTSDMWAVGATGDAAHYDGVAWTAFNTNVTVTLRAVVGVGANLGTTKKP